MDIVKELHQGSCDVTLSGTFTFNDYAEFRGILQLFQESTVQRVVLHLSRVEFIDSAALGMLLLALDESKKCEKPLVLSGATGQVGKMFDMARFSTMFTLH